MTLVAGVDSSTQSCKVVIRELSSGEIVRSGRAAHPSGTEVHADAWWDALLAALDDGSGLQDVSAVSIAGQQHGMVILAAAGRMIRPALLWNDTRSASAAAALADEAPPGTSPVRRAYSAAPSVADPAGRRGRTEPCGSHGRRQVFDVPIVVPEPAEYVALGAATRPRGR